MIKMVTENAHKAGIPVGICGELAADPELTEWFADIGVDELSVVPAYILKMRQMIRQLP
jgi:phosphotransferase system enzyme I (PtsI)